MTRTYRTTPKRKRKIPCKALATKRILKSQGKLGVKSKNFTKQKPMDVDAVKQDVNECTEKSSEMQKKSRVLKDVVLLRKSDSGETNVFRIVNNEEGSRAHMIDVRDPTFKAEAQIKYDKRSKGNAPHDRPITPPTLICPNSPEDHSGENTKKSISGPSGTFKEASANSSDVEVTPPDERSALECSEGYILFDEFYEASDKSIEHGVNPMDLPTFKDEYERKGMQEFIADFTEWFLKRYHTGIDVPYTQKVEFLDERVAFVNKDRPPPVEMEHDIGTMKMEDDHPQCIFVSPNDPSIISIAKVHNSEVNSSQCEKEDKEAQNILIACVNKRQVPTFVSKNSTYDDEDMEMEKGPQFEAPQMPGEPKLNRQIIRRGPRQPSMNLLYYFIANRLVNDDPSVTWLNKEQGVWQIYDPDKLSVLWAQQKGYDAYTWKNVQKSLRSNYKKNILVKDVPNEYRHMRHVYQFGSAATGWRDLAQAH